MGYDKELLDATIEDLSCKLADGSTKSDNHYATLLLWLNWQKNNSKGNAKPRGEYKPFKPFED